MAVGVTNSAARPASGPSARVVQVSPMIDPLITRATKGDPGALEAVLAQVAPAVRRFGLRMCRDPHDADDAFQDTLLAIATRLGEYEGRASFSSWVFTLVRTACARRRRGLKNLPPVASEVVPEAPDLSRDPEQRASDAELSAALSSALDALPDEQREVIQLRDVEGLSAAETAAVVGITVEAVKSRLHRSRAALRNALRPISEAFAPERGPRCPEVMTWWSRRIEGEVSTRDCAEIEKHVSGCGSCSAACETLRRALGACQRAGQTTPDPEVQRAVVVAVRRVALG